MTLRVRLSHRLGDFALDAAFEAPPGLTVLYGPSGSGKTSVVNAVAGLLRPDSGRIAVDDWVLLDSAARLCLPPHRRRLGYVFQEGRLFPHLSVRQNLRYGRWFAPRAARGPDMARVVEMLGIGPLLDRRPGALSGGEKSRVAIGRALLAAPRLILADEPLAALDEARKAEILPYFERLRDEGGVPILYVSHASAEVARLATTVVALRAGRIAAVGPPSQVLGDPRAVGVETASILSARVAGQDADGLTRLLTPGGPVFVARLAAPPGTELRLRIGSGNVILSGARPEGISALNILTGRITAIVPEDGPNAQVTLALGPDRLTARITRRSLSQMGLAEGQGCHAILKSVAVAPGDLGLASDQPGHPR
ncbi:molybdenum ABC transporter ATP-binding protein [Paracoccus spongiarum]|uniref:Molybdenum ABC transporter ATP-binding protein n=1 Tax=Paracoccus spongiarum TaxID=3064387 RepID=A0ABT9JEA4_9RHOB|nr:molybdenum ABC transporter ATP-binding protein [Paracoccus sp. 2205BS29-5]MDP5307396.1 molybdenum ABC transporter ATP-binding protein [Paracoccus sp. 2205BS29-5]